MRNNIRLNNNLLGIFLRGTLWLVTVIIFFQNFSKASDRTNLGTSAAPINCLHNPVKLKFIILLFLEQPFYENYPTLDSCDTSPFTHQDGFENRHKVYSVAYGSTKIEFLIFQNNRVFFASAFLSVQFKSNTEYSVNSVF